MTILRSNLFRLLFKDSIYKYALRMTSASHPFGPVHLDEGDRSELEYFLNSIDQFALTDFLHVYTPYEWPHQVEYTVTLLRGEELRLVIQPCRVDSRLAERETVLRLLIDKLMANTKFLQAKLFKSVFNSFDEKYIAEGVS